MNISKETPYGFVMVLSGVALLAFAAIVFIGLTGMCQGQLIIPIASVAIGVIAIFYCLLLICKWKQVLSAKDGMIRELLITLLMLLIMLCGASPVSNVISALDDKEGLQENVDSIIENVSSIAPAYKEYVEERTEAYRDHLVHLHTGSDDYNIQLSKAAGDSKKQKAKAVVNSLKRRLINPAMEDIEAKRAEWLNSLTDINAFTQRTASMVASSGVKWIEEYNRISSIKYAGEEVEPFDMPELKEKLLQYRIGQSDILHPSFTGLIITLLCFLMTLTPYLLIRRSGKSKSGTHI